MGKPAYNRSCYQFLGRCIEDDWEFIRVGQRPLHDLVSLPRGADCWQGSHVPEHQLPAAKELCCTGEHRLTTKFHGCWNSMIRRDRCCEGWWREVHGGGHPKPTMRKRVLAS